MPTLTLDSPQFHEIVAFKHHLHQHPEISWQEYQTTAAIKAQLARIDGVEILPLPLETGLVARLKGGRPGGCVALRADIDALNVVEQWDSPNKSRIEGKGHMCGHDFHTASLLGAALLLSRIQKDLPGTVIFIFQPAEETTNGARKILQTGLFQNESIQAIFGLHNRPEIETGQVVVQTGARMAAKINFKIVVHGIGGHGSMPHKCVDPIVCASAMVQNVLTIPARNVDPLKSLVLSICSIHGGTPENLIVDRVDMTGSMRYFEAEVGTRALERLRTVVRATAETFECSADFEIVESVPALINAESLYEIAQSAARESIGPDAIVPSAPCTATEDFADYLQIVPGFFYWLGARRPDEAVYSWHHSQFHTDDQALQYGAPLLANSALRFLEK